MRRIFGPDGRPSPGTKGRLTAIDALRGIASMCVILPHFVGFFAGLAAGGFQVGKVMMDLGEYGHWGVDIFFVVSGFVIAFTTLGRPLGWNGVSSFMLRRLTRLAPPYWVSILLMLGVLCLQAIFGAKPHRLGAAWSLLATQAPLVGAHLFYLQDLLGLTNLNAVYWTLCIEVQFYLVFVVGLVLWRQTKRKYTKLLVPATVLLGSSWLVSVLLWLGDWKGVPRNFLPYWHEFALGILACQLVGGTGPTRWGRIVPAVLLTFGTLAAVVSNRSGLLVAFATFGVIWFLGMRGRLQTALDISILQFLGRISYSLYLVHVPIGTVFLGLKTRLSAHDDAWLDFGLFFLAVGCSLAAAAIFYRYVEYPATLLSRRFKTV